MDNADQPHSLHSMWHFGHGYERGGMRGDLTSLTRGRRCRLRHRHTLVYVRHSSRGQGDVQGEQCALSVRDGL